MTNALSAALGASAIGLSLAAIALAQLEWLPARAAMLLFALGGLVGFGAAGAAIAVLFAGKSVPAFALGIAGAIPAVLLIGNLANGLQFPMLNDVTTTREDPPVWRHAQDLPENQGRDMAFPEEFAPLIDAHYPEIQPLRLDGDPAAAYQRALDTARAMPGWSITAEFPAEGQFEAVAVTRMFRFRDDIAVRVQPDNGGSRIDMRSKSRDGRSDLGANARRIQAYFAALGHAGA